MRALFCVYSLSCLDPLDISVVWLKTQLRCVARRKSIIVHYHLCSLVLRVANCVVPGNLILLNPYVLHVELLTIEKYSLMLITGEQNQTFRNSSKDLGSVLRNCLMKVVKTLMLVLL